MLRSAIVVLIFMRWTAAQPVIRGALMDPKSIQLKDEPLSILALGGSVTWGSTLEDRTREAYPWLVADAFGANTHVDNLAIRATGADFPSLCIESLIEEAGSHDRSYDLVSNDGRLYYVHSINLQI